MSAEPTDFEPDAGLPFSRVVRVVDGKSIWEDLDDFEAKMHIRIAPDERAELLYDFTPHLVKAFDGDDILISWYLTGGETRKLPDGFYDLLLSDPGSEDTRIIRPIFGQIGMKPLTTSV